jgi:hypothetical protein
MFVEFHFMLLLMPFSGNLKNPHNDLALTSFLDLLEPVDYRTTKT